jgi:cytochrome P450
MTTVSTANAHMTPPGPPSRFPLGVLPEYASNALGYALEATRKYGPVVKIPFGLLNVNFVVISDPADIGRVLQDNNRAYGKQKDFKGLLDLILGGQSLVTLEGDVWLPRRRLEQPAFHRERLAGFAQVMTDATTKMIERWEQKAARGERFDLSLETSRLTLEIAGRTLFGVDLSDPNLELGRAYEGIVEFYTYRSKTAFPAPLWLPTAPNRAFKHVRGLLDRAMLEVIRERRTNPKEHHDLLGMLMAARDAETGVTLTNSELLGEMNGMIFAGHETSSNALAWTLWLLSEHPEVEAKLRTEISTVLEGRAPRFEDVPKLTYARMVLEEAMRLYPPAWSVAREALEDDVLGGHRIQKGTALMVFSYAAHRDPRYWRDPERFDPERFTPEASSSRPKFSLVTFGGGPRQCIGMQFAMMEMQLALALIVPRYRVRLEAGHRAEPEARFTLQPKGGMPIRLERVT